MPAYEPTRTIAIAILNRTITDGDTLVPEGSTVFITRLTEAGINADPVYACVASVAINCDGVATAWRILAPIDSVTVKSKMLLRDVALNYGSEYAEACEDEATAG